jgi:hypothetical protein
MQLCLLRPARPTSRLVPVVTPTGVGYMILVQRSTGSGSPPGAMLAFRIGFPDP